MSSKTSVLARNLLSNRNITQQFKRFISTKKAANRIEGIFPPICTPFLPMQNEPISWDHLMFNLNLWEKMPFNGYVVHGSNGEYPYLTREERIDLVRAVKENVSKDKIIIAGASGESLQTTVDMCEHMAKHNADYALIITPHFYKSRMTDTALLKYFTKVADKSPIPIILYNMPANTSIDMSVELCVDLASHPNIIGLKDSGGDISKLGLINEQVKQINTEFSLIAGSAGFLLNALKVGCTAGICALANVLGNEVFKLYQLFQSGQLQQAEELQKRLIEPNKYVTRGYGVSALKASLDAFGYYGGPVRIPLLPLNASEIETVKNSFISNGFKWSKK